MLFLRVLALASAALLPFAASASDDNRICFLYADLGIAGVQYMSELEPERLAGLMNGEDTRAAEAMGAYMAQTLDDSGRALLANAKLDWRALGGAASNAAFILLISGEAETLNDAADQMVATCLKFGPRQMVADMKGR